MVAGVDGNLRRVHRGLRAGNAAAGTRRDFNHALGVERPSDSAVISVGGADFAHSELSFSASDQLAAAHEGKRNRGGIRDTARDPSGPTHHQYAYAPSSCSPMGAT